MHPNPCFPDGTPIADWFFDVNKPTLSSLGKCYSLTDAGIAPDGLVHTAEIQALIDRIHREGGGVLYVPHGTFRTGALFFRPGVHLYVEEDGVLLGSDEVTDYPVMETRIEGESCLYLAALINADGCDGFTMCGKGTIDGNGLRSWKAFWHRRAWNPACTNKDEQRPRLVYIANSQHVTVSDLHLQNAMFWTNHLYRCRYVRFLDCSIYSPYEPVKAPSTDAIDLDVCTDVVIRHCDIHVNDDGVVLKGGKGPWADHQPENGINERILIEDCHYRFCHGCLTLGSEAIHCRNILLRNITVDAAHNLLWLKFRPDTPQCFEYVTVEGARGTVDQFLNIHRWTQFFDLKGREDKPASIAHHIKLRRCEISCSVGYQVPEDLSDYTLSDFTLEENQVHAQELGNTSWL